MRRTLLLGTSLSLSLFFSCSSPPELTDPTEEPGGKDGTGGRSSEDPDDLLHQGGAGNDESCASNVLCGPQGSCCAEGQECAEGACADPCDSGVRCAGACCAGADQVCLAEQCVDPGAACSTSFDCEENEFCEPTLERCLPQPSGENGHPECIVIGEFAPLEPQVEWRWPDPTDPDSPRVLPSSINIVSSPVVLDVDGDQIPDVFVVTIDDFSASTSHGYLRRLNGRTGKEIWSATADVYQAGNEANTRSTLAAGDLDGDGRIEIVVGKRGGGMIAFDAQTGALQWRSTKRKADDSGWENYDGAFNSQTIALADLDGDGKAEVVSGGIVLDHEGRLVARSMAGETRAGTTQRNDGMKREFWGSNDPGYGAVSIVADVDGDDDTFEQFVVTGKGAYRKDGSPLWEQPSLTDGYAAIADLDVPRDGIPELVVVAQGRVRVQDATTGALLASHDFTLNGQDREKNHGGPPTIADFDGDGVLEFASAGGYSYNVFEFTRDPVPTISLKWSRVSQDLSSNVTGSSVFDFEGDGKAEVVYGDECYSRVYDGTTGEVLFEIPNSSATIHEYPILVDVDGDNNTEFLVVANKLHHGDALSKCPTYASLDPVPSEANAGILAYGDPNNRWVRTRRVWNQHAYHQTNINNDGRIPPRENRSWSSGFNNDYRVSSQGTGVFNAPDLSVDLEISTRLCPEALELHARVRNKGSLGVPAGVPVQFFLGDAAEGAPFETRETTRALLPGQSEAIVLPVQLNMAIATQFTVLVDGVGSSVGNVSECLEDNNTATSARLRCPVPR